MEPITDVFKTMHVASVVHARLEATAPWGLTREGEGGEQQTPHSALPGYSPSQFAHFGMVSRGNCWLSVEGIPAPFPLTAHRWRLFPAGAGQHIHVAGQPKHARAELLSGRTPKRQ